MSKHSKIGSKGEQIAADFLIKKGYIVLQTNWRSGKKEVDIVARERELLVFVEVKTRSGKEHSYPEDAVTRKKQELLKAAADAYMSEFTQFRNVRFDIISVLMDGDAVREIMHFEEAFH